MVRKIKVKQVLRSHARSLSGRATDKAPNVSRQRRGHARKAAAGKPAGTHKLIRKYGAYALLVLNEWLLGKPDDRMCSFLLEVLEHRYDNAGTVFCTQ